MVTFKFKKQENPSRVEPGTTWAAEPQLLVVSGWLAEVILEAKPIGSIKFYGLYRVLHTLQSDKIIFLLTYTYNFSERATADDISTCARDRQANLRPMHASRFHQTPLHIEHGHRMIFRKPRHRNSPTRDSNLHRNIHRLHHHRRYRRGSTISTRT